MVFGPDFLPIPTDGGGLELYGGPAKVSYTLLDTYTAISGMTTIEGVDMSAGSGVTTTGSMSLTPGLWQISVQVTPGWGGGSPPPAIALAMLDMGARATALPMDGPLSDPLWVNDPIGGLGDLIPYNEITTIPILIVEISEYTNLQVQIWVDAAPGAWSLSVLSIMKQLIDKIR